MNHSPNKETAAERRLLCSIAIVCYSATLASLTALAYSLSSLALSAATQQITVMYSGSGI